MLKQYTNATALYAAEEELFGRWEQRYETLGWPFLRDGGMPEFTSQDFRLLFILKEGNDPKLCLTKSGGDLRDAPGWQRGLTWSRLAHWASLIIAQNRNALTSDETEGFLREIACLNLKKRPGGGTAKRAEIIRSAQEDRAFIVEQIRLYDADLIVCCGPPTFEALQHHILGIPDQARWFFEHANGDTQYFFSFDNAVVMDCWHPQARMSTDHTLGQLAVSLEHLRLRGVLKDV